MVGGEARRQFVPVLMPTAAAVETCSRLPVGADDHLTAFELPFYRASGPAAPEWFRVGVTVNCRRLLQPVCIPRADH